jgi:very-short-patch-repair endonuclease
MRAAKTPAEHKLFMALRDPLWKCQHPMMNAYIADFYHPRFDIVVELDGGYHTEAEQMDKDRRRDSAMQSQGFHVVRFTNQDVYKRLNWVLATITQKVVQVCAATGRALEVVKVPKKRKRETNGGQRSYHVIPKRVKGWSPDGTITYYHPQSGAEYQD